MAAGWATDQRPEPTLEAGSGAVRPATDESSAPNIG